MGNLKIEISEIIQNYQEAEETIIKGQRFLKLFNGKNVYFGYPYPDTKEKYIVREILSILNKQ